MLIARVSTVKDPLATRLSELTLRSDKLLAVLLVRIDQPLHIFAFFSSARVVLNRSGIVPWNCPRMRKGWTARSAYRVGATPLTACDNGEHPCHDSLVLMSATRNPVPLASMMT